MAPKPKPITHGTHAGAVAHRARGEKPCDDCLAGDAAYNRDRYRNDDGRKRRFMAARSRAWGRLAKEYPERYRELLAEEIRMGRP